MNSKRVFVCIVIWQAFAAASDAAADDVPSAVEILEGLERNRSEIRNARITSKWEFRRGGEIDQWTQEITCDDLGRIAMKTVDRMQNVDGKRVDTPKSELELFDGEKTVSYWFHPGEDRLGVPISQLTPRADRGFHAAQIQDGAFPAPNGPWATVNPITMPSEMVIKGLKESIDEGRDVEVSGDKHAVRVRYVLNQEPDLPYWAYIDPTKNYAVTRVEATKDGKLRRSQTTEYAEGDGSWRPTKGTSRGFTDASETVPAWEFRFQVVKARYNDPAFDESVFEVRLPPDTAVSDLRYNATYRAGSEGIVDNQLAEAAERALREDPDTIRRRQALAQAEESANKSYVGLWLVLATSIAILASAVAVIAWRIRQRGEQ